MAEKPCPSRHKQTIKQQAQLIQQLQQQLADSRGAFSDFVQLSLSQSRQLKSQEDSVKNSLKSSLSDSIVKSSIMAQSQKIDDLKKQLEFFSSLQNEANNLKAELQDAKNEAAQLRQQNSLLQNAANPQQRQVYPRKRGSGGENRDGGNQELKQLYDALHGDYAQLGAEKENLADLLAKVQSELINQQSINDHQLAINQQLIQENTKLQSLLYDKEHDKTSELSKQVQNVKKCKDQAKQIEIRCQSLTLQNNVLRQQLDNRDTEISRINGLYQEILLKRNTSNLSIKQVQDDMAKQQQIEERDAQIAQLQEQLKRYQNEEYYQQQQQQLFQLQRNEHQNYSPSDEVCIPASNIEKYSGNIEICSKINKSRESFTGNDVDNIDQQVNDLMDYPAASLRQQQAEQQEKLTDGQASQQGALDAEQPGQQAGQRSEEPGLQEPENEHLNVLRNLNDHSTKKDSMSLSEHQILPAPSYQVIQEAAHKNADSADQVAEYSTRNTQDFANCQQNLLSTSAQSSQNKEHNIMGQFVSQIARESTEKQLARKTQYDKANDQTEINLHNEFQQKQVKFAPEKQIQRKDSAKFNVQEPQTSVINQKTRDSNNDASMQKEELCENQHSQQQALHDPRNPLLWAANNNDGQSLKAVKRKSSATSLLVQNQKNSVCSANKISFLSQKMHGVSQLSDNPSGDTHISQLRTSVQSKTCGGNTSVSENIDKSHVSANLTENATSKTDQQDFPREPCKTDGKQLLTGQVDQEMTVNPSDNHQLRQQPQIDTPAEACQPQLNNDNEKASSFPHSAQLDTSHCSTSKVAISQTALQVPLMCADSCQFQPGNKVTTQYNQTPAALQKSYDNSPGVKTGHGSANCYDGDKALTKYERSPQEYQLSKVVFNQPQGNQKPSKTLSGRGFGSLPACKDNGVAIQQQGRSRGNVSQMDTGNVSGVSSRISRQLKQNSSAIEKSDENIDQSLIRPKDVDFVNDDAESVEQ